MYGVSLLGLDDLAPGWLAAGDTVIEVGCSRAGPLAIEAVQRGAQGALVIERQVDRLARAAERVQRADMTHTVRLARGDFLTWPLIPATHVICNVGNAEVIDLLPRLRVAARGGDILLTRLRKELRATLTERLRGQNLTVVDTAEAGERFAMRLHGDAAHLGSYQVEWRGAARIQPPPSGGSGSVRDSASN